MDPREIVNCIEEMIRKYGHYPELEDIEMEYDVSLSWADYYDAEDIWFEER